MNLVTGLILLFGVMSSQSSENVPVIRDFSSAVNGFSVELLQKVLQTHGGNVIISPMSVSTLLAMLLQGARDNSRCQLESVLLLDEPSALDGYGSLSRDLKNQQTNSSVLELGNRIFLNTRYTLDPDFDQALKHYFDSSVQRVDFVQPAIATRNINDWVAEATHNKIRNIIGPDSLSGNTQLVLANAIFFKGLWKHLFDVNRTRDGIFSTYPDVNIKVPFMRTNGNFRAGEDSDLGAMWIELPFAGETISMVVVVPTQRHGLDAVVNKMTSRHIGNMMNTRTTRTVLLAIPKFKLNSQVPLVPALQQMGLTDIFSVSSNLAGISKTNDRIQVSDILQKADIEIDEKGGAAAAATLSIVNTLSLSNFNDDVKFLVDHPFLVMIVYKAKSVPLFIARVNDPSQT